MSYCTQCGTANPDDAKFCHFCGRAVTRETTPPAPSALPSTFVIVVNVLLLLLIQAGLLFLVPVFAAMFADFGSRLPRATQILVDVSAFWKMWWWLGNVALYAGFVALRSRPPKGFDPALCLLLTALVQGLILLAMFIALLLPIIQLGQVATGL